MLSNLYRPGRIGPLELRNRIVMTAMHAALSEDGTVGPALLAYFGARARGGAGLIVVGAAGVDPVLVNTHNVVGAYDDRFVPGLARLAGEIRSGGSRSFLQLFHPGRYGKSAEYSGQTPVAPSPVPSLFTGEMPRELTEGETAAIVGHYADAARRAKEAGFDGVEVTAASGYLPAQFLSPLTNRRTDRYGGDLEGRMTFLREIIGAIRNATGKDFPLMIRLGASDLVPGSHTADESLRIACALEKEGVDAISLTGGWHESAVPQLTMDVPKGFLAPFACRMKKALRIPLVLSNRLTPEVAEDLVDSGLVDFAAFGRPLLADPDMPAKAAAGRYETIRPCIACNQGCMDRIFFGESIRCLVNPEAGRESLAADPGAAPAVRGKPRSILVVGAGVAGLNYAAEASRRGHRPVLWERGKFVGGQAALGANLEERSETARYVEYLARLCEARGIPVVLGKEADAKSILDAVRRGDFDSVVLATGKDAGPATVGTDGSVPVCHGWDVLGGSPVPGNRIVIKGGNGLAIWTALKLAARGRMTAEQYRFLNLYGVDSCEVLTDALKGALDGRPGSVVLVNPGKSWGSDIGRSSKWVYFGRLKALGVEMLREGEITEVRNGSVTVKTADGEHRSLGADILVETESFVQKGNGVYDGLKEAGIDVSLLGDALRPGNLFSAVEAAYAKGAAGE